MCFRVFDRKMVALLTPESKQLDRRGRPKGSHARRIRTAKFTIAEGMDALADTADKKTHPECDWDGRSYPKTKRSHGPSQASLNDHAEVLLKLFRLAPNGYLDVYNLRDLWLELHTVFGIFEQDLSTESRLPPSHRAMLAADRWRVMCKHCVMLYKSSQSIPGCFHGLKQVLASIRLDLGPPAETASVQDSQEPDSLPWAETQLETSASTLQMTQ